MKLLPILILLSIGTTAQQRVVYLPDYPSDYPKQIIKSDTVAIRYATITPAQYNQLLSEFRRLNDRLDTMQYRINLILINQRK